MEATESTKQEFNFRKFFLRSWLTNIVLSLTVFVFMLVYYVFGAIENVSHTTFLFTAGFFVFTLVHTMFLLIFSVRRFGKQHYLAGLCFFLHFLISATLVYYLYIDMLKYLTYFTFSGKMIGR